jgi:predicted ATP-grasp superfamily ATP-dependent carboligase
VNGSGTIVIASASARPYARAAAAAGYRVVALDAFADTDTCAHAAETHALAYRDGGFDANALDAVLSGLKSTAALGLAYGSGFEQQPDLLALAEQYMPLIGNPVGVVRSMKRAQTFFALLDDLNIPHPAVRLQQMSREDLNNVVWLLKRSGGSGGTHIRRVTENAALAPGSYYQQEVKGIPVSLLFAADGSRAHVIGFNQQWLAPAPDIPFRYGGAVSHAEMPPGVRHQLLLAAQKLTAAASLRGLNSLDAIMQGDRLWILELNPRLTATFDLYPTADGGLFQLHLDACRGNIAHWPQLTGQAYAHYIFYAPEGMRLPADFDWPDWVADIPRSADGIASGEPVCTVTAQAATAAEAVALMAQRVRQLVDALKQAC